MEYVPPGTHRANKAERAIQTWKAHFIACLCTTDPAFPMKAWDGLVSQAELTQPSARLRCITPHVSLAAAMRYI